MLWTMRVCTVILKICSNQHYVNDFGMVGMSGNHMYIGTTGDHQALFYRSMDDVRIYKNASSATDDEMWAICSFFLARQSRNGC